MIGYNDAMSRKLDGMVVLITGASSGIGWALAEALHARGAKLALAARRLSRLQNLNRQLGDSHMVLQADVSREEDCQRLVAETVAHFGRLDTLVCNAGYGLARRVADTTHEELLQIFQTNVFGTTDCIAAAVPLMFKQEAHNGWRGQVVIVSSAAGRRGLPYFGAYSATKAAQLSLAEALRVELKPKGIAVTSVHPVGTSTEFFETAERLSGRRIPKPSAVEVRQSAQTVARRMLAAIQRPRPELWPHRPMRWAVNLGIMFPRVADRIMSTHRRAMSKS